MRSKSAQRQPKPKEISSVGPGSYEPNQSYELRASQKHYPGQWAFAPPTTNGEEARKRKTLQITEVRPNVSCPSCQWQSKKRLLQQASAGGGPGSYNPQLPMENRRGMGHVNMSASASGDGRQLTIMQWQQETLRNASASPDTNWSLHKDGAFAI